MRIRILSFNAGLLRLFGRSFPTPFIEERASALPRQIEALNCDIVLLQEIYGDSHRRKLAQSLEQVFPYAIAPQKKRNFGLQNGLMTLSRYPATGHVELFSDAPLDETFFDSKGLLLTEHTLPGDIVITTLNLHTTAGGMFSHPESAGIEDFRSRQIQHVIECSSHVHSLLIVAGDLNAGPGVSEVNFRQLLDAGFVSSHDLVSPESNEVTWDPLNSLNAQGPHKACPPQRIDHVFLRSSEYLDGRIRAVSSTICLKDPFVHIADSSAVSLSDHYGICVEVEVEVSSGGLTDAAGDAI